MSEPTTPHRPQRSFSRLYLAAGTALKYDCDIALPNGINRGLGDVLVLTPVVEQLSRHLGRRVCLATAPIDIKVKTLPRESLYPVWQNNPYIERIVGLPPSESGTLNELHQEINSTTQFSHIIENTCMAFGLRARSIRPQIYLAPEEQSRAIERLSHLRRPLLCVHPAGKTSPKSNSPWFLDRWIALVERYQHEIGIIQIGKMDYDRKSIGATCYETSIREMFATIWASDFFIGFDSAPMHVARSFEIPALILWDAKNKVEAEERHCRGFSAAVLLRWGYAENRNVILLNEQEDDVVKLVYAWIEEQIIRLRP